VTTPGPQTQPEQFTIEVDGQALPATAGQTVAAVLLAAGRLAWHRSVTGASRGVFCGMGVCYDCTLTIDGWPDQRACIVLAAPGMQVETALQ
jgi:D-hydroxyproline dehydrogenase subunit gamma